MRKIITNKAFIGKNVFFLPSCHSTNSLASQLIREGTLHDGDVLWTLNQTAGRGQQNNQWESSPGKNLTCSVTVFPQSFSYNKQFFLNIVTSLAVKETLDYYNYPGFIIKWPNDIYYYNNKICGILIENQLKSQIIFSSIIGIGININQESFASSLATSLKNICGHTLDIWEILMVLLDAFEKWYSLLEASYWSYLKEQYEANLYWREEWHIFKADEYFKGKIKGVDDQGKLLIACGGSGIKAYNFKEISFVE